jgi:GxxExxY protein
MEVHRELGCGFLEPVYQEALAVEFELREIPFQREVTLPIRYKGRLLKSNYRVDFVAFDAVLVELKALCDLSGVEESQIIHYLKASGKPVGLLVNFGRPSLEFKRFAN